MQNSKHDKRTFVFTAVLAAAAFCSCGDGGAEDKNPNSNRAAAVPEQPPVEERSATSDQTASTEKWSKHARALLSDDWRMRKQAAERLQSMGKEASEAIPALITALGDRDDEVRSAVSAALGAMGSAAVLPLVELMERTLGKEVFDARVEVELTEDEWNTVFKAAVALRKIGPEARGASDCLMRIIKVKCKDPIKVPSCFAAQGAASDALGQLGAGAVPVLMGALNSNDPAARAEAAKALGKIGKDAADAVPVLTNMLGSEQESVCEAAATALSGIGKPAIPALLAAFHEQRPMVREPAVKALIRMGPDAKEAVPELKKMLSDPKKWTRRAAEEALEKIE